MAQPPRILILECDASRAEVLSLVLRQRLDVEVEAPAGALDGSDALRTGGFDALVLAPLPWASPSAVVARARAAQPDARVVLLLPTLDEGAVREALSLRVDEVLLADAGAPLRVAERLVDLRVAEGRVDLRVPEEALPSTVPGRRAPSRVDDAPTQQMPALRQRAAQQLAGPRPALEPLLSAAGIATFRASASGRILRTSAAAAERLGPETSPSLGVATEPWAALVAEAVAQGVATATLQAGGSAERLVAITLLRAADGSLDGLLQDRSETEALWQRLERLRLAEGEAGGDVIALDERRAQRAASTDPGAPVPEAGGWRRELALASHDLQEPVRSMRIYAELLEEQLCEERGLIGRVGLRVRRRACSDTVRLVEAGAPDSFRVMINLSGKHFLQKELVEQVQGVLRATGCPADRIGLELTETSLMGSPEAAAAMLGELRAMGVQVLLDDFGTGFASLAYLQRFPIDCLKIDAEFIAGLGRDSRDEAIVQAILGLARNLGKGAVAEGIETDNQLHRLRQLGCEEGQGYLFSEAVDIDAALSLVRRGVSMSPMQERLVITAPGRPLPTRPRSTPGWRRPQRRAASLPGALPPEATVRHKTA